MYEKREAFVIHMQRASADLKNAVVPTKYLLITNKNQYLSTISQYEDYKDQHR